AQKARPLIEAERSRPRIAGVWQAMDPPQALRTEDGKLPPLNVAGRKLQRTRAADPMDQCLPPGTPRILSMAAPFLVTQAPAKVMVFHQARHLVRHIWLDGPLKLDDPDPTWEGISSGGWQGDTLVIETASFNGRQWLDAAGLPQSPDMKVTERWHLLDANTLDVRVTIDDPTYYAKPWTTKARFRRLPDSTEMPEEECSEKLLEFPLKSYAPE
ncbi:MAG: hypothetical protein RLZZ393_2134, partial [Pseudomonadota bacterium]